ncbi:MULTISPECIES: SPOR domain-containing protein [unclassified Alteromonas]|uniref:SPOR domain-containing protein n=1 Tax=unclassified Alteromonas TaxID=2614992 RepID=UPI000509A1C2|nr:MULTISPECIES: SPOR domain-containing protein [unclassified Alteromonas]
MQNELHERLEYLVNYSSQLIFVSGDSIAQQQKTLEAFVFQQHDDTEIAYLTAQETMDVSDYRRQLCRQLLGQVIGSFVRPLNELLVDLNNHEGPILVAITQSHHLPDSFLQELWDLVLQSRFAGNKQHLNVLLFADRQWAERAKQWLPAKNTETPLIISSQSVIDEQPNFASDLDKMIATRREAFQAHLENRQQQSALTFSNPLKSRWLYVLLLCVFVSTFSGLVYWQYGDDIASLFAPIDNADGANANLVAPGSAYDQIAAETNGNEAGVNTEGSLPTAEGSFPYAEGSTPISGAATIKGADEINNNRASSDDTVNTNVNTQSNEAAQNQPEALITSWQNAISKDTGDLPKKDSTLSQDKRAASGTSENANAANTTNLAEPKSTPSLNTESSASGAELDVTRSTETPFIAPNEYALQMLAMKNEQVLNDFIEENNLAQQTRVYKTRRYGGDWYVVLYAQTFSSATQAQQAKQTLPDYPGNGSAFVKNGQQILQEIALSESQ